MVDVFQSYRPAADEHPERSIDLQAAMIEATNSLFMSPDALDRLLTQFRSLEDGPVKTLLAYGILSYVATVCQTIVQFGVIEGWGADRAVGEARFLRGTYRLDAGEITAMQSMFTEVYSPAAEELNGITYPPQPITK